MSLETAVADPKAKYDIILVDDEADMLFIYGSILESRDYTTQRFTNGADALVGFAKHEPHAAIFDFKLPGMTGLELYRKVQEIYPDVQVLFSSGSIDAGNLTGLAREYNMSVQHFLPKPCTPELLLERVGNLCRLSEERFSKSRIA